MCRVACMRLTFSPRKLPSPRTLFGLRSKTFNFRYHDHLDRGSNGMLRPASRCVQPLFADRFFLGLFDQFGHQLTGSRPNTGYRYVMSARINVGARLKFKVKACIIITVRYYARDGTCFRQLHT
ncbi:enoyl-CoA hydratase [Anopheles sinensis]|uniref:Enoyl-CoA hydratase n=1 Tax=Anopheles sinensis TaxID=74873 RepID=A0A084W003_ANOSI|nr:enoyl-CoA hydratase [Anopheles sinensis]